MMIKLTRELIEDALIKCESYNDSGTVPVSAEVVRELALLALADIDAAQNAALHTKENSCEPDMLPEGWVAVPLEMTPSQMRAIQLRSEAGGYITSNLSGAYSLLAELWEVALAAAPKRMG